MKLKTVQRKVEEIHRLREEFPKRSKINTINLFHEILLFIYNDVGYHKRQIVSAALKAIEIKFPIWS